MTLSIDARILLIESVRQGIADGSLQLGQAVKRLRVEGAGMLQSDYAQLCRISVRTLIQIEQGEGNPTLKSLNAVFRPFGLQMGVVRRQRHIS